MAKQTEQLDVMESLPTHSLQRCGDYLTIEQTHSFNPENKPDYQKLQTLLQAGN